MHLGASKGYRLVACTLANAILVAEPHFEKLEIDPVTLEQGFPYEQLCYVISQGNGELFLSRYRPLNHLFRGERTGEVARRADSGFWPVELRRR